MLPSAVMMTMGVRRVSSFPLRAAQAVMPSMTGIVTSMRMRSGDSAAAFSRASLPFPADSVA